MTEQEAIDLEWCDLYDLRRHLLDRVEALTKAMAVLDALNTETP